MFLWKLAVAEVEKGIHTGAKKRENGTPLLRAKAQSCRDAAASAAIAHAVQLIIIMAVMASVAAALPVTR
jgi:hypothetical protein